MLHPGQLVSLQIEKPAAGGPMIARADGQVVLVSGAIPGERVRAHIDRIGKGVAYASVQAVEEPSTDRREPSTDPLCGGCLYAHMAYPRQLAIKAQVVADAFARIGRLPLSSLIGVAPSPQEGYRMRARLHVRDGAIGFFREGSHALCDPRPTGQLLPQTCDVIDGLAEGLGSLAVQNMREVEIAENVDASERVAHFHGASAVEARALARLGQASGLTGLTVSHSSPHGSRLSTLAGSPHVVDVVSVDGTFMRLRRHVAAFFQGNRYLLNDLVRHVVGQVEAGSVVYDLYAGTGLFAVPAAVARQARVTAIEGDRAAAIDLEANAQQTAGAVHAVHQSVEAFVEAAEGRPDLVIVDPPRTGLSRDAMDGVINVRGRRVVYVSCDPATLARDARRLVDGGYAIQRIDAFDLFPNTPHVETVAVFQDGRT